MGGTLQPRGCDHLLMTQYRVVMHTAAGHLPVGPLFDTREWAEAHLADVIRERSGGHFGDPTGRVVEVEPDPEPEEG